jgi:hypothetical protein
MKTENNFTETAETLKENVAKGIKWMQDANAKLVETQKQQMKTATDMFNKILATSQVDGTNNLNKSFAASSKAVADIVQKNIEATNNVLKTILKPVTELTKFSDKESLAKEMEKQVESLNKKIADLTILNQTNLDTLLKEFSSTTKSFTPLTEQFKKELEKVAATSKETMQTIVDSYTAFSAPSVEANKETIEKLNEQIKTSINANIKFWSDLINSATTTPSTAKTTETKVDSELLKISAGANNKKHTTVHHN